MDSDAELSLENLSQDRDFATAVVDTVGALIVVLDREGRIVRFNHACEQATGYTAAEAVGRVLWDFLLPPGDIPPVKAVFAELREGFAPNTHENYWVARDGSLRLITWSNTAILGADGKPEFIIGTGIDITEQREAEQRQSREEAK
jgi:PAS domain S-box-containing protein